MTLPSGSKPESSSASNAALANLHILNEFADQTSREILSGEFSSDGAGQAGITFRSLIDLGPDDNLVDAWSIIITLCDNLWSKDFKEASISLIKISYESFHVPAVMERRIKESLDAALDYKSMASSHQAFTEGNDDKAVSLMSDIRKNSNAYYLDIMKSQIKGRTRSRRAALGLAGFSISSLVIIFGIGVVSTVELLKDPPRPELPDFTASKRVFEDMFPDRRKDRRALDPEISLEQTAVANVEVDLNTVDLFASNTDLSSIALESPPLKGIADIFPANKDMGLDAATPEKAMTPIVSSQSQPENKLPSSEPVDTSETKDASELKGNCVTAYAALNHATRLLKEHDTPEAATQRLAAFMATIKDACAALKIDSMELSILTGKVDPSDSERIAKSVLQ